MKYQKILNDDNWIIRNNSTIDLCVQLNNLLIYNDNQVVDNSLKLKNIQDVDFIKKNNISCIFNPIKNDDIENHLFLGIRFNLYWISNNGNLCSLYNDFYENYIMTKGIDIFIDFIKYQIIIPTVNSWKEQKFIK